MDTTQFDNFTRELATVSSRRKAVASIIVGGITLAGNAITGNAKKKHKGGKKGPTVTYCINGQNVTGPRKKVSKQVHSNPSSASSLGECVANNRCNPNRTCNEYATDCGTDGHCGPATGYSAQKCVCDNTPPIVCNTLTCVRDEDCGTGGNGCRCDQDAGRCTTDQPPICSELDCLYDEDCSPGGEDCVCGQNGHCKTKVQCTRVNGEGGDCCQDLGYIEQTCCVAVDRWDDCREGDCCVTTYDTKGVCTQNYGGYAWGCAPVE